MGALAGRPGLRRQGRGSRGDCPKVSRLAEPSPVCRWPRPRNGPGGRFPAFRIPKIRFSDNEVAVIKKKMLTNDSGASRSRKLFSSVVSDPVWSPPRPRGPENKLFYLANISFENPPSASLASPFPSAPAIPPDSLNCLDEI